MAELEFHFDFLSPYGYFASRAIDALAARHQRQVNWCPMLLGVSVVKVMGLKPLLDTPLKGNYVRNDVLRQSRLLGLRLGREVDRPPKSSLVPARAVCWAKKHTPEAVSDLVHALYGALWAHGIDIDTPEDLMRIEPPRSVQLAQLVDAVAQPEAAALLREAVERSIALGIFGSPTVIVDGELFWGHDRLPQVDQWLTSKGW